MIKKSLSVLLAALMLAGMFSVAALADGLAASGKIGALSWTFNSATGALKITGEGLMPNYSGSASNQSPFYRKNEIKSVEIGEGITSVGSFAFFQCLLIKDVDLPSSLEGIGEYAFAGCSSLKKIDFPLRLKAIGKYAFSAGGLVNVTITKNVTSIGQCAFSECNSLNSFTVLGDGTKFANDGFGALYECSYGIKTKLLQFPIGSAWKTYIIPDTVTEIDSYAFHKDAALETVLIPSSVEKIGSYAFFDCTSLSTVGMGSGVKNIGAGAFRGCSKLWDVYVEGGDDWHENIIIGAQNEPLQKRNPINDCAFGACGASLVWFCDGVDKTLTVLGEGNMDKYDYDMNPSDFGYYDVEKAVIGKNVSYVSDYAFWNCASLRQIVVSAGNLRYTTIDGVLFTADGARLCAYPSAKGTENYEVPGGTVTVAPGAFGETCDGLEKVTLPYSLKTVGYGAFENCGSLTNVTYKSTAAAWADIEIEEENDPLTNAIRLYTADRISVSVTEPKIGETPVKSINKVPAALQLVSPFSGYTVNWTPADAAFAEGKAYTVTVTAELKSNYRLPDSVNDVAATINGNPANVAFDVIMFGGKRIYSLVISYTFPTLESFILGDVDGDKKITAGDARLALRRAVDLETYAEGSAEFRACDVDKDGSVTAGDARSILRAAVELEDPSTW